jgi:predicted hydrocarbon binding protein
VAARDKDVMVYKYDRAKRYFLVSFHLENKPGALGNLTNLLGIRDINILEGFFGGMSHGPSATVSFFVESSNKIMDAKWLKEFLQTSVYVSDVEVKQAVDGILTDSLNFPLTWNNGDRAILMRTEGLRNLLEAVKSTDTATGEASLYSLGFTYGRASWESLLSSFRPTSKDAMAELLGVYSATGWGRPELTDFDMGKRKAKLKLRENFECEGVSTGAPASNFVRGHISGAFSALFGGYVRAVEKKCTSKGDDFCEFEVSP